MYPYDTLYEIAVFAGDAPSVLYQGLTTMALRSPISTTNDGAMDINSATSRSSSSSSDTNVN